MKKIEIVHPIAHDGKEYERGKVYEMSDELAGVFLADRLKHAARLYDPKPVEPIAASAAADTVDGRPAPKEKKK